MTLLFDQNLSYRLPAALADLYPDSTHVRDCGLANAPDEQVWLYAIANSLAIEQGRRFPSAKLPAWTSAQGDLATRRQLFDRDDH